MREEREEREGERERGERKERERERNKREKDKKRGASQNTGTLMFCDECSLVNACPSGGGGWDVWTGLTA